MDVVGVLLVEVLLVGVLLMAALPVGRFWVPRGAKGRGIMVDLIPR